MDHEGHCDRAKAAGTYEWVFANRGARFVGEDYDGLLAGADAATTTATTATAAAAAITAGTAATTAAATTAETATTTADELAAAAAALSVAGDALFVRMRVNASLLSSSSAAASSSSSSSSSSSALPVPVDASVVSFVPGAATWSLELLDLGGRSYYDVMIVRRGSRITQDMSPIALADGFVVDTAALPTLPSDGELPAAGLRACLDGYQAGPSDAAAIKIRCGPTSSSEGGGDGDDLEDWHGELFVSSGTATCTPVPCDSVVPPLGDARIGWFLEGFDLEGVVVPADTRQPWAQNIQKCLHGCGVVLHFALACALYGVASACVRAYVRYSFVLCVSTVCLLRCAF